VDFLQVDVFAEAPFEGNPLAVFPDAGDLTARQMQRIAREMNLSESTFVTASDNDSYAARIFTPEEELAFAGHPTLGTAWVLNHAGKLTAEEVVQSVRSDRTPVTFDGDLVWAERSGTAQSDIEGDHPQAIGMIAAAVGLEPGDIGMEAREIGRSGRLRPAFASAGLEHLLVPVKDLSTLERARPAEVLRLGNALGAYCFAGEGAGRIRARGFFPGTGIPEDPGTGSAVAALGIYLADRVGSMDCEVHQGIEMNKPSRIHLRSHDEKVSFGGRCRLVFTGRLEELP
jgi:trans-2,3-dihydro-3-hydroxyanthranilate isomerase